MQAVVQNRYVIKHWLELPQNNFVMSQETILVIAEVVHIAVVDFQIEITENKRMYNAAHHQRKLSSETVHSCS